MREIGSEFHYCKNRNGSGIIFQTGREYVLVFSGRTAIETVLHNEPSIHKALIPSYCCDSMIEPFRKAKIDVEFYSVNYDGELQIDLEIDTDIDCILWCNYFGFSVLMPDLTGFINRGGIVIEDVTHSFYSKEQFHKQSHYLVASLRKWEPLLCGGICVSGSKKINHVPNEKPSEEFLIKKRNAMDLKKRYLTGDKIIEKSAFLNIFSETNEWLAENYSELKIDDYSKQYLENVDFENHREQRIRNARILYEGLKEHPDIHFLFSIEAMDCPLFVPVLINNRQRDAIRNKLIDQEIYCPVHWSHPKADCLSNLYETELSLICDHRYNEEDMRRIVEVLNNRI